jgi:hypothetical protein
MPGSKLLKFLSGVPIEYLAMSHYAETRPHQRTPLAPDRRAQERVLTSIPIRIVSVGNSPTSHPGMCKNLSRRGVGFDTEARLELGQIVDFEFVHPTDAVIRYSIEITSRNGQHYGGRYVDSEDEDT